jgi:hypothetical protein
MQSNSPTSLDYFGGAIYCPFCTKRVVMREYEGFIGHLMSSHQFTEQGAEMEVGRVVLRYIGNQGNVVFNSRWMKPELERLYVIERKTLKEIGYMFGVSKQRVSKIMKKHGITKPRSQPKSSCHLHKYRDLDDYFAHSYRRKHDNCALLRKLLLRERGACCELCEAVDVKLHIHHYRYPAQRKEDVVLACFSCHWKAHDKTILPPLAKLQLYMDSLQGTPIPRLAKRYHVSDSTAGIIINGLSKVHHILFPDSLQAQRIKNGWGDIS